MKVRSTSIVSRRTRLKLLLLLILATQMLRLNLSMVNASALSLTLVSFASNVLVDTKGQRVYGKKLKSRILFVSLKTWIWQSAMVLVNTKMVGANASKITRVTIAKSVQTATIYTLIARIIIKAAFSQVKICSSLSKQTEII